MKLDKSRYFLPDFSIFLNNTHLNLSVILKRCTSYSDQSVRTDRSLIPSCQSHICYKGSLYVAVTNH